MLSPGDGSRARSAGPSRSRDRRTVAGHGIDPLGVARDRDRPIQRPVDATWRVHRGARSLRQGVRGGDRSRRSDEAGSWRCRPAVTSALRRRGRCRRASSNGPKAATSREPSPWHEGSWENSLTAILHHRDGLALPDLGGISHQTIAGYVSTGSAGGTVKWSIHDAIARLRVIDGAGRVTELTPDGDDPDWFRAAGIGLGLCGVISTITFRCIPTFDIVGRETVSATRRSNDLDFYGDRPTSGLPSLEQFLVDADYARLMWWPQRHFDRLVVWQARRARVRAATPAPPLPRNRALSRRLADRGLDRLHRAGQSGPAGSRHRARESAAPRKDRGRLERRGQVAADDSFTATRSLARRRDAGRSAQPDRARRGVAAGGPAARHRRRQPARECIKLRAAARRGQAAGARCVPEHIDTLLGPFVSTGKDGAPVDPGVLRSRLHGSAAGQPDGRPADADVVHRVVGAVHTRRWAAAGNDCAAPAMLRCGRHGAGRLRRDGAFAFELYVAKARRHISS